MLSRDQYLLLNTLADGSEPFSMIYSDLVEDLGEPVPIRRAVQLLVELLDQGLARLWTEEPAESRVSSGELLTHYDRLVDELDARTQGGGFYYSKGEYFFEMTARGRQEWDDPRHRQYYASEGL